jgi:hypothetical protein
MAQKETMKASKIELATKLKLAVSPKKKDQAPLSAILARHYGQLSSKVLYTCSGIEIDGFCQQLKAEMEKDWIEETEKARAIEKEAPSDTMEAV